VSSECTSECPATLTGLKNPSVNLWQKMPNNPFGEPIWGIDKITGIYRIISAINVKVPPEAWVLSWLPSIAQTGNNTRTHLGNCPAPP
jgi:hypothetical protein